MASASSSSEMRRTAFVIGATGEVGKALVADLLASDAYAQVTTIGRKPLRYDGANADRLKQEVVDFERLQEFQSAFQGHHVGFCCLGTTRSSAGSADNFRHIDHDYTLAAARLAKTSGCSQFHLVTAQNANPNSPFLYPQVKGQIEQDCINLNFEHLVIYRPGMLLCDREESRPLETFVRKAIMPVVHLFSKTGVSVNVAVLARAMRIYSLMPVTDPQQKDTLRATMKEKHPLLDFSKNDQVVDIVENSDLHRIANMKEHRTTSQSS